MLIFVLLTLSKYYISVRGSGLRAGAGTEPVWQLSDRPRHPFGPPLFKRVLKIISRFSKPNYHPAAKEPAPSNSGKWSSGGGPGEGKAAIAASGD